MDHSNELYGFPTSVNLRYFASNYQEKQREVKQKKKELANAAIQKEVLKIKENPWEVFSGNRNVIVTSEGRNIEDEFIDNYYVDLLKLDYLLTARGVRSHNFKLLRLLFHFNTPVEGVSLIPTVSEKPNVLNNCILLMKTAIHSVKNKIRNLQKICLSFIHKAIYLSYCWKISSSIQRLVIPLKDISILRKMSKHKFSHIYLLKTHSQYDLMFAMLSIFWSDSPKPVVFFNGNIKSCSILEKVMFTLIDWKNIPSEGEFSKYDRLRTQLEPVLKKERDVLFCLHDNHEEELEMLCQIMKEIVKTPTIPDAFLITVNFSFEVTFDVIENALLSNQKLDSDFAHSLSKKKFNSNLGLVRVKFGTPFSVKEVIDSCGRNLLQKMTNRLEWELSKSQILMSTGLISFILLYKFRDGVKLIDLIKEVDRFKQDLDFRGKLVGFSGNAHNIVNHAIHMLKDKIETVQINNEYIIKPVLRLPNVLSLSHLSQSVLNYFVLDAAMMTCLVILFGSKLENTFKGEENLIFNHTKLIERIEELCEILQFEFNFDNPSIQLSNEISAVIFKYVESEYFVKNEKLMTEEEKWGHRLAKHLESDDEDDDSYRSNAGDTYTVHFDNNGELYSNIVLYQKTLQPILESYLITIGELKSLINKHIIHSELIKLILLKLKSCSESEQLKYPESISLKHVCSCIKLMEKWNVLESYTIDEINVLFLSKECNNERSLYDIEFKIRSFLTS